MRYNLPYNYAVISLACKDSCTLCHTCAIQSRIRVNPILSLQIKAAMLLCVSARNVHCTLNACCVPTCWLLHSCSAADGTQEVLNETTARITSTKPSYRSVRHLLWFCNMSTVFCPWANRVSTAQQFQLSHTYSKDNTRTHFTRFVWLEINFSRLCIGFHLRSFGGSSKSQDGSSVESELRCAHVGAFLESETHLTNTGKYRWSCVHACLRACAWLIG